MTSFQEFGKDVVYTIEYMELFDGMTLSDTMRHNTTLCDGVGDGGIMVGWLERNQMRDSELNEQSIYSGSLI